MKLSLAERHGGRVDVQLDLPHRSATVEHTGVSHEVTLGGTDGPAVVVEVAGQRHTVEVRAEGGTAEAVVRGRRFVFRRNEAENTGHDLAPAIDPVIRALVPGRVLEIRVVVGQRVEDGEVLAVVDAMKMENPVLAPAAGVVVEIGVSVEDRISQGQVLLRLDLGNDPET